MQINITSKQVYVQHDPNQVTASDIAQALSQQGFPAVIRHNGGGTGVFPISTTTSTHSTDAATAPPTIGRTTLHTEKALHPQDVPVLQQHLTAVDGVEHVDVNVREGIVFVDHNVTLVSTSQLCKVMQSQAGY